MGLLPFNFVYHLAFHVSAFHVCCPVRVPYLTQSHRMEHVLFVVTTAVGSMPPTGNSQYAQFSTEDFLMCSLSTTSMFTVVICLIKYGDQRHGGRSGCSVTGLSKSMLVTPENRQAVRKFARQTSSVTNTIDAIVLLPVDCM